jgi:hypothetical protein
VNKNIEEFCRNFLKKNIVKCSEGQVLMFKRMYSNNNLDLDINIVIDKMPIDKLDWAMQQIERTITNLNKSEIKI